MRTSPAELERLKALDEGTWKVIVVRYQPMLLRLVRTKKLADQEEDILSRTFTRAMEKILSFRDECELGTWLYSICLNMVRDELRKGARHRTISIEGHSEASELGLRSHEGPVLTRLAVQKALASLPPAQANAIVLVKVQGLSFAEAADQLGTTTEAVKQRVYKGLKKLAEVLR